MVILGVNSAYHETAAALIIDGQIAAAAEEERFNRRKHGKSARVDNADDIPISAMRFCLTETGLSWSDVDHVGYSFDPWARRSAKWNDDGNPPSSGDFGTDEGEDAFFRSNLKARELLCSLMRRATFHFFGHHLSHAASAYYASTFDTAGVLVVDGIAESASTWAGIGTRPLFEVGYPHSLGFLWEKTCEFLGFDRYDGPGKVMALGTSATAVDPISGEDFEAAFSTFVMTGADGQFSIDPSVLGYRAPHFQGLETVLGPRHLALSSPSRRDAIAAGLQQTTERVLVHLANSLWTVINSGRTDKVTDLCMAGGVALNCAANRRILEATPWSRLFIQPAANDAGTALGAAMLVWNEALSHSDRPYMNHAYWGPSFEETACERALLKSGLRFERPRDIARAAATALATGKAVGWFQGRMEFGPRALGNRSILADARNPGMRSILNSKIKERESFRPFAPSVLEHVVTDWFRTSGGPHRECTPSEYMLMTAPSSKLAQATVPAVVHENRETGECTARVHVVRKDKNPAYEHLLATVDEISGAPIVLNTSFNVSEPIVCTPADACRTFERSGLDAMVIGPFLVNRA